MAQVVPRILTLHIDQVAPGMYRTEISERGEEEGMYASIGEAIREESLAVPDDFAHFMEVRYSGLSSGTIALSALPEQANAVADRLVELMQQMHVIAEG